jgi:hypothetical protein
MNSPSAAQFTTSATEAAATLFLVPRAIDRLGEGRRLAAPLLAGPDSESDLSMAARGAHPDLLVLVPPEKRERIGIDQVREVIRQAQFSPVQANRKVCLIPRAEALTPEAANALLKVMEEPPRDTAFVLLAEHPSDLLPTIISRCRSVRVPPPSRESIVGRLTAAGYESEAAAWLAALPLRDGDLARLTESKVDVAAERETAGAARTAPVPDVISAALSDDPIRRHEALVAIVERIGTRDPELLTVGVRVLAGQDRDVLARFLQELLTSAFGLLRATHDPSGIRERTGADRLRALCRAIDTAYRSIVVYGPAEAVLLSLMLTPGGDADDE